jgi:hypothetical protein
MALFSFSRFYTGITIDATNRNLNFNEGAGELTAVLEPGSYSLSEIPAIVKTAMDVAGLLEYTVTVSDRDLRFITISSTAAFDLLTNTGAQAGTSPFSDLGYSTAADLTALTSYESTNGIGFEYRNQFLPQRYVGPDDFQERIDAAVNESAAGIVQVVSYGIRQKIEFDLKFITSRTDIADQTVFRFNSQGVEDARTFMQSITQKQNFEFMPDEDAPNIFYKVLLMSTPESSMGVGYKLKELTAENITGIYDIGKIVMRVVT